MTHLRPWAGFDSLVDGLARLQERARKAAVRSVDEILTLRNWLIGTWIVGRSNLKNCQQIAHTWLTLWIRQTLSGESLAPCQIWQTLSAESMPQYLPVAVRGKIEAEGTAWTA